MAEAGPQPPGGGPSRHKKNLGFLTTKFVPLLQEAKDGMLDLKLVADTLAVRQKRHIYDITNVLEGIGLIEKKSKNSIQWKGMGPGCNTREIAHKLIELKAEIEDLEQRERELEQQKIPPAGLDMQPLQSSTLLDSSSVLPSPSSSFEPIKSDPTEILELPKELSEMFDPTRECMNSELLEELMSSEVFTPLLHLSPPPGDHDYIYNLDESEGVCNLFDVPILNL
ncbi:UNVERIFIED_CONTAM: hypothetical protein K2H54_057398 [Gekko kuhli]